MADALGSPEVHALLSFVEVKKTVEQRVDVHGPGAPTLLILDPRQDFWPDLRLKESERESPRRRLKRCKGTKGSNKMKQVMRDYKGGFVLYIII